MARGFAAARNALDEVELAVFGTDGEDGDGVFASDAGVEGETVWGDGEFGSCVFVRGKVGGDGFDRSVGVDEEAPGVVGEAGCGPKVVVDGGVDLVDAIDPAVIWVEDNVTRPGAGPVVGEELRIR